MADISKITLPSGNTYEIKDAVARQMISGGVSFIVAWDGTGTPVAANLPKGVVAGGVTGTLEAADAQAGAFYLVKSSTTPSAEALDIYDEYVVVGSATKSWEKIGDTQLNLTDVVTGVSLTKQTDVVLGEATTFSATDPTITVTPSTTYIKGTASGANTAWNSKDSKTVVTGYANTTSDTFVKSVSAETNKNLVTTTVPNVTNAGSASTWSFTMGSGDAAETLIINGANSVAPTLGTAKTVATGATSTSGTGAAVVTGVTVGDSATALTGLGSPSTASVIGASSTFTITQPTVAIATDSSSGTGKVQVATGISSASASGTGITVGTNDKITVLKSNTDISVSKGNA